MLNKNLVFLILLFLISTITCVCANEVVKVGGLSFNLPDEYLDGKLLEDFTSGYYLKDLPDDGMFRIWVWNDIKRPDTVIGYMIDTADTVEEVSIGGHTVIFANKTEYKNFTYLIFEAGGKLVLVQYSHHTNITDDAISIIKSTSKSTVSRSNFENLVYSYIYQYRDEQEYENSLANSYSSGYSQGSKSGYNSGYEDGLRSGFGFGYITRYF